MKRKASKLVCAFLVILLTFSMFPVISVVGYDFDDYSFGIQSATNPDPYTGLANRQAGIRLVVDRVGTQITVTVHAHLGSQVALDGLMGRIVAPIGQNGLTFVSGSRVPGQAQGWDHTGAAITASGNNIGIAMEPADIFSGVDSSGPVASATFSIPSVDINSSFLFTWEFIQNFSCMNGAVTVFPGQVLTARVTIGSILTPDEPEVDAGAEFNGDVDFGVGPAAAGDTVSFVVTGQHLAGLDANDFSVAFEAIEPSTPAVPAWITLADAPPAVITVTDIASDGTSATVNIRIDVSANVAATGRQAAIVLSYDGTEVGRGVVDQGPDIPATATGIATTGTHTTPAGVMIGRDATGQQSVSFVVTGENLNNQNNPLLTSMFNVTLHDVTGGWLTGGTVYEINVLSNTRAEVVVRYNVTANDGDGALARSGQVRLNYTGLPLAFDSGDAIVVTQGGAGGIIEIPVVENIVQGPSTVELPIYLTSNPGVSSMQFRVLIPRGFTVAVYPDFLVDGLTPHPNAGELRISSPAIAGAGEPVGSGLSYNVVNVDECITHTDRIPLPPGVPYLPDTHPDYIQDGYVINRNFRPIPVLVPAVTTGLPATHAPAYVVWGTGVQAVQVVQYVDIMLHTAENHTNTYSLRNPTLPEHPTTNPRDVLDPLVTITLYKGGATIAGSWPRTGTPPNEEGEIPGFYPVTMMWEDRFGRYTGPLMPSNPEHPQHAAWNLDNESVIYTGPQAKTLGSLETDSPVSFAIASNRWNPAGTENWTNRLLHYMPRLSGGGLHVILGAFIGDVDGNRSLNARDVSLIAQYVVDRPGFTGAGAPFGIPQAGHFLFGFVIPNADIGCTEWTGAHNFDPVPDLPDNAGVNFNSVSRMSRFLIGNSWAMCPWLLTLTLPADLTTGPPSVGGWSFEGWSAAQWIAWRADDDRPESCPNGCNWFEVDRPRA